MKMWADANKLKRREEHKKWRDKTQEIKAGRKRPKRCEVCKCNSVRELHFDHCHKTKKFRGWLCHGCNIALGGAKDNPKTLRRLADYLEVHVASKKKRDAQ